MRHFGLHLPSLGKQFLTLFDVSALFFRGFSDICLRLEQIKGRNLNPCVCVCVLKLNPRSKHVFTFNPIDKHVFTFNPRNKHVLNPRGIKNVLIFRIECKDMLISRIDLKIFTLGFRMC